MVNNASAISLTGTLETPMKKVDLMLGINLRGTYLTYEHIPEFVFLNRKWAKTLKATETHPSHADTIGSSKSVTGQNR